MKLHIRLISILLLSFTFFSHSTAMAASRTEIKLGFSKASTGSDEALSFMYLAARPFPIVYGKSLMQRMEWKVEMRPVGYFGYDSKGSELGFTVTISIASDPKNTRELVHGAYDLVLERLSDFYGGDVPTEVQAHWKKERTKTIRALGSSTVPCADGLSL